MDCRTLFSQLTGCIVTLIVGSVGVTTANSVMAQHALKKMPFQMAQSSCSLTGSWRLVVMGPTSPAVVPQATELTADFSSDSISGSGGCNRFSGGYKIKGNQLSIGPLASTFKACEEPLMNQEMKYLAALQGAQRYEVDNQGQLTIFYQTEQESGVLRFER